MPAGFCIMPKTKSGSQTETASAALRSFIAKFSPEHQRIIRAARRELRRRMPSANELVYDNYNFFVVGYCASERPSDCIVSLVGAANGIGLSFYYGTKVSDPHGLLLGSGSQNRFIRLSSAEVLSRKEVKELIASAIAVARTPLPLKGRGRVIVRVALKKHKPRRASA
jgi:hypothetical protein